MPGDRFRMVDTYVDTCANEVITCYYWVSHACISWNITWYNPYSIILYIYSVVFVKITSTAPSPSPGFCSPGCSQPSALSLGCVSRWKWLSSQALGPETSGVWRKWQGYPGYWWHMTGSWDILIISYNTQLWVGENIINLDPSDIATRGHDNLPRGDLAMGALL